MWGRDEGLRKRKKNARLDTVVLTPLKCGGSVQSDVFFFSVPQIIQLRLPCMIAGKKRDISGQREKESKKKKSVGAKEKKAVTFSFLRNNNSATVDFPSERVAIACCLSIVTIIAQHRLTQLRKRGFH